LVKKKVKKGAAVMQPLFLLFLYGVYKWSTALAADIAVKALLTSTFDETLMCVMDEATRLIYQGALDRHR